MASAQQYLDLYDSARGLIGERANARKRLAEMPELDEAFAPEDYGMNLQRLAIPVGDIEKTFGCDIPTVSATPAVVVNDIFSAPTRLDNRLPQGVRFMSLRKAAEECPQLIPADDGAHADDGESRLNDLLWTDGVFIYVPSGVCLDKPLQLVNIFSSPVDLMAIRRIVIVVEKGARADLLICDHTRDSERRYLSAEIVKINLGEGASLGVDFIEESSALTTRRTTLSALLGKDASLECTCTTLSCGDSRMRLQANLRGQGARASVNGMVIADKEQKASYITRINHLAENTVSNQLFKYVADGNSRCAFDGKITVDEKARFAEAFQTNRNLLASEQAVMHTQPALEIYCDEVKCSHGAATGQLDENALFYMRQRGIPEAIARKMLMEAFVADVIDGVHISGLRDRLRHLVERRFSGLGSDVVSCADCGLSKTTSCHDEQQF